MSIHLGLFYAKNLGNRVHCTFIIKKFVSSLFLKSFGIFFLFFFLFFFFFFFLHTVLSNPMNFKIDLCHINGTVTDITTSGQNRSGGGVIAIKRYSTLPRSPELEPHNQLQFSVIPRIAHFFFRIQEGFSSLQKILLSYSKSPPKELIFILRMSLQ